jgi:hypothetical protein
MASASKGQKTGAPPDNGIVVVDPVLQLIFNDIRSRDAAVRTQGAEDLRLHVRVGVFFLLLLFLAVFCCLLRQVGCLFSLSDLRFSNRSSICRPSSILTHTTTF